MDSQVRDPPGPTFLTLPLELRNAIYTFYISVCGIPEVSLSINEGEFRPLYPDVAGYRHDRKGLLHLFLVNRQVHAEVSSIFWPLFRINFKHVEEAQEFCQHTSARLLGQIRHVILGVTARPLHRPETAAENSSSSIPLYQNVRAKLPNLETVCFVVRSAVFQLYWYYVWREPKETLLRQIEAFRDVGNFSVKYQGLGNSTVPGGAWVEKIEEAGRQPMHKDIPKDWEKRQYRSSDMRMAYPLDSRPVSLKECMVGDCLLKGDEDEVELSKEVWQDLTTKAIARAYQETPLRMVAIGDESSNVILSAT
ncbi:MAG: hypothetical protein M1831_006331 [Alyxoria varia]|nr:MAG: hypothetical protein M1831_006331 [Alyxoria varia]